LPTHLSFFANENKLLFGKFVVLIEAGERREKRLKDSDSHHKADQELEEEGGRLFIEESQIFSFYFFSGSRISWLQ
jgi:hypothetical protein